MEYYLSVYYAMNEISTQCQQVVASKTEQVTTIIMVDKMN